VPSATWSEALLNNQNSANVLITISDNPLLRLSLRFFTFFLIITSFLGVSLSLFDFLSDGLHIPKSRVGRGTLYVLTFGPPLAVSLANPNIFISALQYAGAFGVVIILAIIPALIAYFGRKKRHLSAYRVKGGNLALLGVILISLFVLGHEVITLL
jgi:tyrosine-specific transport protein